MIAISVVIPSRLDPWHLQRVLSSLENQILKTPFEVLLCATQVTPQQRTQIEKQNPKLNLKVLSTPLANISAARNLGLKNAKGPVTFFLDEDCALPHPHYLQSVVNFHKKNPTAAAGGYYLSDLRDSHPFDPTYNLVCNAWLESHRDSHGQPQVLLGGCCFFPTTLLKIHGLQFNKHQSRAGEEYELNQRWLQHGFRLVLEHTWDVFHAPRTSFYRFLKKSWVQGENLRVRSFFPAKKQWALGLRHLQSQQGLWSPQLPLVALYGMVGRISALKTNAHKWAETRRRIAPKNKKHESR